MKTVKFVIWIGVKIHHSSYIEKVIQKHNIKRLIVAIKKPNNINKRKVVDACLAHGVEVLNVPDPKQWINGEFSTGQIKPIKIDKEHIKMKNFNVYFLKKRC